MVAGELWHYGRHCSRNYTFRRACAHILRASRALKHPRAHARLWSISIYRNHFLALPSRNLFHHLAQRHYLRKGLSTAERVAYATFHYIFDSARFDSQYQRAVYVGDGLLLWSSDRVGAKFTLSLQRGSMTATEGELSLSMHVDGERLHTISFSWVESNSNGDAAITVPYISRNQARTHTKRGPLEKFDHAYPQNSPSYFCYAALQGIASTIGASKVLAVRSHDQCCYVDEDAKRFLNTYDGFWSALGGKATHDLGYEIPLPFHVKPIEEVSSKHRKRALTRREHWKAIESSVIQHLSTHLHPARTRPDMSPQGSETAAWSEMSIAM